MLFVDGLDDVEQGVVDVGEDGGTARSDAVAGEEEVKVVEGGADAFDGGEVPVISHKRGGEVGAVALGVEALVTDTKTGAGVGEPSAATAACGGAVMAAMGIVRDGGAGCCVVRNDVDGTGFLVYFYPR